MELKIENFKKTFGDMTIWNNLSTQMESGEIISIHGRSGEGKTTFLRCLNGLESLDHGQVIIDGEKLNLDELGGRERPFGMVFQGFNLFPHLNVWENLILAPQFHKVDEEEVEKRANSILKDLELSQFKHSMPRQLSGGQRQRVAIARSCMLLPKVLCFDEPTSALDEETSDKFIEILDKLSKRNMILVIVTHDKVFANKVSDRILHIEKGAFREELVEKKKIS